jgi:HlyD family secretion protein
MHKKAIIPLIIVVLSLLAALLYFDVFRNRDGDSSRVEGSGTIEVTEIEMSSKIAGRVKEIPFEEGQSVKKGEWIIKLEDEELIAQVNSAKANLINAEANYKRSRELNKSGSISRKDYDSSETLFKVARANLDLISASIGNAVLVSPIDGVVLEKNLEVGEMAFPGSVILTLAELTKPWIKIYVAEKKLGFVKLGQKALVTVDTFLNRKFEGKVVSISSKAEFTPKTIQTKDERVKLMFAVKIILNNPDFSLKPGMPADVTVQTEEKK